MTDQTLPGMLAGVAVEPVSQPVGVPMPTNAIRCSCGEWWTGIGAAHCAGCHLTFTSVSGFTLHRKGGHCQDPANLGMVPADRKYPAWAMPGTWTGPEEK